MKIKKLSIKNLKSLIDIEINEPEPFTIFVGPNGSGKSNIFEAIQLAVLPQRFGSFPQSYDEWINVKNKNFHGLTMDEAWLSNSMEGGIPW